MKLKQLFLIIAVSAISAVGSVWVYSKVVHKNSSAFVQSSDGKAPVNYAGFFDNVANGGDPVDFTKAANAAVPAVVHIKTKIPAKKVSNQLPRNRSNSMEDWFDQFFNMGPQMQPEQKASGSGVIISEAALGFLGLGASPYSWGAMLSAAKTVLLEAPHIALILSMTMAGLIIGLNLLGDGLRDYLDPNEN